MVRGIRRFSGARSVPLRHPFDMVSLINKCLKNQIHFATLMSIPTPERMSIPVQQGMRLTHNNGMRYDIILNVTMMSQNSNLYANSKTLKGRTGMKGSHKLGGLWIILAFVMNLLFPKDYKGLTQSDIL